MLQTVALCILAYWLLALSLISIVTVASGNLAGVVDKMRHSSRLERALFLVALPFTVPCAFCAQIIFGE